MTVELGVAIVLAFGAAGTFYLGMWLERAFDALAARFNRRR